MKMFGRLGASALALAFATAALPAWAQTRIEFFFPVPVDGKLAKEMTRLVKVYNGSQKDVEVTAVYTGSYDDTKLKAQAAAKAGKPPSVVLMSANFTVDLKLSGDIVSLEPMLKADETTRADFLKEFWPAVQANATVDGELYGVPFQNSTPLLYYNVEHFKEAGLDPAKPPRTWAEFVDAAKKLTKGDRYGFVMPASYDYLGWLMEALSMSNGGRYFNEDYGGEVYYDQPSMLGAAQFVEDLIFKHKVMPQGVTEAGGVSTAFLAGKASMVMLSTGSLSFIREKMKDGYNVAFVPKNVRNAVPIGGASLVMFAGQSEEQQGGRLEVHQVADGGRHDRRLEPVHRLLLAAQDGLRPAGDEGVHRQEPRRQGGARPAALRQAVVRDLPDRGRAQGAGGRDPGHDERQEEGRAGGQGRPDEGRRDHAALRRADRAEAAAVIVIVVAPATGACSGREGGSPT